MRWLWFLLSVIVIADAASSLLNPNSVARPSVTFGRDRSPLEKDIAAIFNKVAHGSTAPPPNSTTHAPTTTSAPTTTHAPITTTAHNVVTPFTNIPDAPDFLSKPRFKPPLPPEYTNPFADKAILRGSQSEGGSAGSNRRQLPPPPPPPIRPPIDVERIPIRPPDLAHSVDRKKPLNTPAGSKSDDTNHVIDLNKTEAETSELIPIMHHNHHHHQNTATRTITEPRNEDPRNNQSNSRVLLDHVNKDSMIDVQTQTLPSNNPSQDTPHIVTEPPRSAFPVPAEWPTRIGGITWDVIIYTIASLFVLLAVYSFAIGPFRAADSLINPGAYVFLHIFIFVIGVSRSGYLFYDAYNVRNSFSPLVHCILLDSVFPCLFSAFFILFYSLANMTKVNLCHARMQNPTVLGIGIVFNLALFVALEYTADRLDLIEFLVSTLRGLPLLLGIIIVFAFLIAFRCIYRAARRLQGDVLRANFSKMGALPRRPRLKLAARIVLSAAFLILALCSLHLYTLYAFSLNNTPPPWPWWCCQMTARLLEICICCLLVAVAWLRRTGVPTNKLTICCCVSNADNKSVEDMFPAICSKNNAIHNYSIHTGKTVYDDATSKSTHNTDNSPYIPPPPIVNSMSLKRGNLANKCGTMPTSSSTNRSTYESIKRSHYNEIHVKSTSMLFEEDGVVRFKTSDDLDDESPSSTAFHHRPSDAYHSTRRHHEALTAFNISEDSQIGGRRYSNRSGSLGELTDEKCSRSRTRPPLKGQTRSRHRQHVSRPLPRPRDESPVGHSSFSASSSSDLSESDLTSQGTATAGSGHGYERVRTHQTNTGTGTRKNPAGTRNLRYKSGS